MGVIVRVLPRAATQWRKFARKLGDRVARSGGGVLSRVLDGYIFRALGRGGDAVVTVLEPAVRLAFCQPYLFTDPETGQPTTVQWYMVDIPAGRDPWRIAGAPLVYGFDTGDVTDANVRRRWYRGVLPVGDPVTTAAMPARGVFAHYPGAITTGNTLAAASGATGGAGRYAMGTPTWLLLLRMNLSQRMFKLSTSTSEIVADGRDIPSSVEQISNITIRDSAVLPTGVTFVPMGDNRTISAYTSTPGYVGFDVNNGVFYAHTFQRVGVVTGALSDFGLRGGVSLGQYRVEDPGPTADQRFAVLDWSWHDQSPALFAGTLLDDSDATGTAARTTEIGLLRGAFTPDGRGLVVAAVRRGVTWNDGGTLRGDTVRGVLVLRADGAAGVTVARADAWALGALASPASYHYTPILGWVSTVVESDVPVQRPLVACHRLTTVDATGMQGADDVALVVFDTDGAETVAALGDYFPVTYVPRDAAVSGARVALGYDYPVSTGDWQLQVVQSVCQCGPDELAVLVRPRAQFLAAAIDTHIAIVRASTGALLAMGPALYQGSMWALASVTCIQQGVWGDDGAELEPATLQFNVFRESGAPAEVVELVRGTYLSTDSGRTARVLVNYGASLVYYLGTVTAPAAIGG